MEINFLTIQLEKVSSVHIFPVILIEKYVKYRKSYFTDISYFLKINLSQLKKKKVIRLGILEIVQISSQPLAEMLLISQGSKTLLNNYFSCVKLGMKEELMPNLI